MHVFSHIERFVSAVERGARALEHIARCICKQFRVVRFNIFQLSEDDMITGVKAGVLSTFVATPVDAAGNPETLPAGITPVWLSSDTTNAPVVVNAGDPSGLTVDITPPASAPTSGSFTLTVSATLLDGSVVSSSASVPFLAPPVTGFQINQTV